jgi:hypothetical protein
MAVPQWEYDTEEVKKALQQLLFGGALTSFLVYQFNFSQVLLIQSIMLLRTAYGNPLVQVHLLGRPADGKLARPFKVENPMGYARRACIHRASVTTHARVSLCVCSMSVWAGMDAVGPLGTCFES